MTSESALTWPTSLIILCHKLEAKIMVIHKELALADQVPRNVLYVHIRDPQQQQQLIDNLWNGIRLESAHHQGVVIMDVVHTKTLNYTSSICRNGMDWKRKVTNSFWLLQKWLSNVPLQLFLNCGESRWEMCIGPRIGGNLLKRV